MTDARGERAGERATDVPKTAALTSLEELPHALAAREPTVHDFDAGELGCGSGLPGEVRRRLAAIAVGDRLRVVTHDPAAREDLPALTRLLGHRVLGVEQTGNATTITMERTR